MTRTRRQKPRTKAIAKWDEELAKYATEAAKVEAAAGGGQLFSIRGGQLSWQDSHIPNNEMAVIIVDTIFENVLYEGKFDPDTMLAPTCFAFAREEGDLTPHQIVVAAGQNQSTDGCKGCEHNEWGSADTGRGKACRNTRRLALLPAGTFNRNGDFELFEEENHYATATVGFLKLPVTSVKGYANMVKQVAGAMRRPPFGVIIRVSVMPDPKTQFKVNFDVLDLVPDYLMGTIMRRREEVMATIDFPYQLDDVEVCRKPPNVPSRSLKKKSGARRPRKY